MKHPQTFIIGDMLESILQDISNKNSKNFFETIFNYLGYNLIEENEQLFIEDDKIGKIQIIYVEELNIDIFKDVVNENSNKKIIITKELIKQELKEYSEIKNVKIIDQNYLKALITKSFNLNIKVSAYKCPKCGETLEQKTDLSNNNFYVCSDFPNCETILNNLENIKEQEVNFVDDIEESFKNSTHIDATILKNVNAVELNNLMDLIEEKQLKREELIEEYIKGKDQGIAKKIESLDKEILELYIK